MNLITGGIALDINTSYLVTTSGQPKIEADRENLNPNQPLQAQKQQKVRLKKSKATIYRDLEDESPIKSFAPKVERYKGLSKEEEDELDHLMCLTKIEPEPPEPTITKPMRKVKMNRMKEIEDLNMAQRSPSKVAVRLRIPKEDRSYGFRNRDDLKSKPII